MFDEPGCPWCQKWHKEIGAIYPNTAIGRSISLRRVVITDPWPADLKSIGNVRYTPTFILLDRGREIGRIVGYTSEEFFWGYLEDMVNGIGRRKKDGRKGTAEVRN